MNKKSKEIVKKLCFTLVVVISIISIIGCPNTVSNKANDNPPPPPPPSEDPVEKAIEAMRIKGNDDPIITDLRGLGFGMKDNKLCLSYGEVGDLKGKPKLLSEAKQDIEEEIGVWDGYPTGDSYSNIKDGLEKRWFAAKETVNSKGGTVKWLNRTSIATTYINTYIGSAAGFKNQKAAELSDVNQHFAVYKNENVFVFTDNTAAIHFADWEIVFVEKVEDPNPNKIPEMYSFHYGPYTLWDKGHSDNQDNPNSLVNVDYNKYVHMFTLSGMLKDYLINEKKVPEGIADQVVKKFSDDKDKYDVYLVIGKVFHSGSTFFCYDFVFCSFRNVLKLSDYDYWKDCWEP